MKKLVMLTVVNELWKLLLLLAIVVLPSMAQSLHGGHLHCRPDQEGQDLPWKMPGNIVAHCKCIEGILARCQLVGPTCERKLEGCHFVERSSEGICQSVCQGCGTRKSGETWTDGGSDPCFKSHCFSGVITRLKVLCPQPTCYNATKMPGMCCPSCPATDTSDQVEGCMQGQELFAKGETKPDPLDPCNECTCEQSGRLVCERRACPVMPCEERLQRTEKGMCCPTCLRRHEASASQNGKCLFRGKMYRPGSTVFSDLCTNCTCSPGAFVICQKQTCPSLSCAKSKQKQEGNSCCPSCPIKPTMQSLPAARPSHCIHEGMRYADGQSWDSRCARCTCSSGETHCALNKCPTLHCPVGRRVVEPQDGKCCPECERGEEGVCTVFGDPHYRTFDGSIFNFQGSCKYLLASDCQHGVGNGIFNETIIGNPSFTIRITNDARDSTAFSWLRTVTVRLDKDVKISLLQRMKVKVNGKRVELPYIVLGRFSIFKDGYRVVLRVNGGILLLWDGVSFLELTVPPKFRSRLCGLCGNFNGNRTDDFYGRDGGIHPDGQSFGNTWRVGGLRACSVLPRDLPRSYEPQCSQSWESKIQSDRNCNVLNSALFHMCKQHVDSGYYYNACKLDMCECPGDTCHCEVLTAYARECERAGITVPYWREATGCQNVTSFMYWRRGNRKGGNRHAIPTRNGTSLNEIVPQSGLSSSKGGTLLPGARGMDKQKDRVGEYLPGCMLHNAKHCKQNDKVTMERSWYGLSKAERKKRRKEQRKLARQERRRKRKQMRKVKKQLMKSHIRRRPGSKRRRRKKKKPSSPTSSHFKEPDSGSRMPESLLAWSSIMESGSERHRKEEEADEDQNHFLESQDGDDEETERLLQGRDFFKLVASAKMRLAGKDDEAASRRSRRPLPLREEKAQLTAERDFKRQRRREDTVH